MAKTTQEIYLTMKEFERIPEKELVVKNFKQKPDYSTVHHDNYWNDKQVFIKPEGRVSWV